MNIVTAEQLAAVAGPAPAATPRAAIAARLPSSSGFDVRAFVDRHLTALGDWRPNPEGGELVEVACPFNPSHAAGEAVIGAKPSGALWFKCQHASCEGRQWVDVRQMFEPRAHARGSVATRPTEPKAEAGTFAHDLELALADVQSALGNVATAERRPLFVNARDLFTRDYPATQWLVSGLLTRGGVGMVGAEPKSAKTWVALEIALAVATGTPVCREFDAAKGTAAYFFAEDLDRQVRNRLRALLAGRALDHDVLADLHVCPRGKFLDLTVDADLAWVLASCRQFGAIDLLVLDPLRDLHSGEEDKSDSMRDVMRRLRLLAELLTCTVVASHHTSKQSADTGKRRPGQRMRGSSAIHGSTDSGIYLGVRGGDSVARFEIEVDSEIKGARSAGHFDLELTLEDDASGAAVRASWTVSRSESKRADAAHKADDDAIFEFVRGLAIRGQHLSRRALRDHDERPAAVAERRAAAALDRMIASGRLELRGAAVHVPSSGWEQP